MMETITLTFGSVAENHVGMSKIGNDDLPGFTREDLEFAQEKFKKYFKTTELIDLGHDAYLLIVRNGIETMVDCDLLKKEQDGLKKDTKAKMYGRVVNKLARHNLCFGDISQEADYETGKGTVIAFKDVPLLDKIRSSLGEILGEKGKNLVAEGNYYYDVKKCGIGFHGDSERKRVIGLRLGATMPLVFQWYHKGERVGEKKEFTLNHGDLYIMSEKATGHDWKKKTIPTLRHAAGCSKFIQ